MSSTTNQRQVWPQADRWEYAYELLRAYRQREGHCDVPARYVDDSVTPPYRLGQWVWFQRTEARKDRLSAERRHRLSALGFSWSGRRAHFNRLIDAVEAVHAAGGAAAVAALDSSVEAHGYKVAPTLRRAQRSGKLGERQIARLTELGFVFDAHQAWLAVGAAALDAYLAAGGQLPIPADYRTASGFHLGEWDRRTRVKRPELPANA